MTEIPKQKHSDGELNELRMRNAFAVRPPIQQIKNQALNPILLAICYLLCLNAAGLALGKIYLPGVVCAALALLLSILIFWKKPRSRHHSAIMAIISLLVLVFGSVYYFEQVEQPANNATNDSQRSTGY
ncbi:MAG: hypothetical protein KJO79_10940 [Verrucomicrobiae bacterium]|nr:hypothetical protein [Verrucomicrobiae bacterium]NNJ87690.1 hypothetical protein [Akkermansiaceae bacterium]